MQELLKNLHYKVARTSSLLPSNATPRYVCVCYCMMVTLVTGW